MKTPPDIRHFHSCNRYKWVSYQILGGKTVKNVHIYQQTTEIWFKKAKCDVVSEWIIDKVYLHPNSWFVEKPLICWCANKHDHLIMEWLKNTELPTNTYNWKRNNSATFEQFEKKIFFITTLLGLVKLQNIFYFFVFF